MGLIGFVGWLFIEVFFESGEFILFEYDAFPPCFDKAKAIAHELYEGGWNRENTYPDAAVSDGRIDEDDE